MRYFYKFKQSKTNLITVLKNYLAGSSLKIILSFSKRPELFKSSIPGRSDIFFKPKWSKKVSDVLQVNGLPGVDFLWPGFIQFNSNKASKVPLLKETPLMFSISARVTGWW